MGAEQITITSDKNRLSQDEIDRMLEEAEQYAEEDRKIKDRVDARNGLESYLFNLKNTLDDDSTGGSLPSDDRKELLDLVDETLDWIDDSPQADKGEIDDKLKDIENVANPIMRAFYAGTNDADGDADFGDDEL